MLRHIVLLTFKAEATVVQKADWKLAATEMCKISADVLSFSIGDNIGSGPNHHDSALVADFKDIGAFRRYIDSAAHKAYVENHARHIVEKIAAIQHEL